MSKIIFGRTFPQSLSLGYKDAGHMPCILVHSDERLCVGESVRLISDNKVTMSLVSQRQGIVDPFLQPGYVNPGVYFWMLLVPEAVGALSHTFDVVTPVESSCDDGEDNDECKAMGCD